MAPKARVSFPFLRTPDGGIGVGPAKFTVAINPEGPSLWRKKSRYLEEQLLKSLAPGLPDNIG
jgi:hypothetical protein